MRNDALRREHTRAGMAADAPDGRLSTVEECVAAEAQRHGRLAYTGLAEENNLGELRRGEARRVRLGHGRTLKLFLVAVVRARAFQLISALGLASA